MNGFQKTELLRNARSFVSKFLILLDPIYTGRDATREAKRDATHNGIVSTQDVMQVIQFWEL